MTRQHFLFRVANFSKQYESYLSCFWHKYEPFWALGWMKMDGCYSFKGTIKQLDERRRGRGDGDFVRAEGSRIGKYPENFYQT
jgi:hypothetical protein